MFFGYLSLALALPVFIFSSNDYFRSAWLGIRKGYLNIDVPISLGILVLFSWSCFEIISVTVIGKAPRIVAGERLVDIAEALHLSIKTVSTHKTRILEKLRLDSTAALIRFGLEHQIGNAELGAASERG